MNKSDQIRIERRTRHLPYAMEREFDRGSRRGLMLLIAVIAAVSLFAWIRL